jgi:DNA-binding NtrC family response regulator
MGVVARLRPMRVLLAGCDRGYLRAADALLVQSRCATHTTEKASEAPGLAMRLRPDVVLLDATGDAGAALRAAGVIQALEDSIEVVVVAEEADAARLGARPKWDALADLAARIEGEIAPHGDDVEVHVEVG